MVRFYGAGVWQMPGWVLDVLYKCITPLRADEATWQTNSSRAAFWMSNDKYRQQMKQWRNQASPIDEAAGTAVINPATEQWFRDNDIPYRLAPPTGGTNTAEE